MVKRDRYALFDFCDTLVNFQTADAFVKYVVDREERPFSKFVFYIHSILSKLCFFYFISLFTHSYSLSKKIYLLQLKGISKNKLEEYALDFYMNVIRTSYIIEIYNRLKNLRKEGFRIAIVSGGYDLYLQYFCQEHNIDCLLCSRIKFNKHNKCTGKLNGLDCMRKNKVDLIEEIFGFDIDTTSWVAFSDSISDMPMLKYVGKAYVVSKNISQTWAAINNFEEIIIK